MIDILFNRIGGSLWERINYGSMIILFQPFHLSLFCLLLLQRFMHRNVVNLLTFNLDGSDISRILLCTHMMLNWEPKHQKHVCVQTETKPARSNQTFAAVSLSRDNDSVNSYHAGSRYLSSSLSSFFNERPNVSGKKLPYTFSQFW